MNLCLIFDVLCCWLLCTRGVQTPCRFLPRPLKFVVRNQLGLSDTHIMSGLPVLIVWVSKFWKRVHNYCDIVSLQWNINTSMVIIVVAAYAFLWRQALLLGIRPSLSL